MLRNTRLPVHAGSVKRRSPLAGATSDCPQAIRVSSRPSRPASRVTVVPWLKAAASPLTACGSEGSAAASPPPTDSVAPAVVVVASGLLTDHSSGNRRCVHLAYRYSVLLSISALRGWRRQVVHAVL